MKDFEIRNHIQDWEESPPSQTDILMTLHAALYLLADALPLAMKAIVSSSVAAQASFWQSFLDFNAAVDLEQTNQTEFALVSIDEYLTDMAQLIEGLIPDTETPS